MQNYYYKAIKSKFFELFNAYINEKYFSTEIKAEDCIILPSRQPLPGEKLVADKK